MSDTQPSRQVKSNSNTSCCHPAPKKQFDWVLWGSACLVALLTLTHYFTAFGIDLRAANNASFAWLNSMASTTIEMLQAMWLGAVLGTLAVGWLNRIPREVVMAALGPGQTKRGILRATLAGVLLDLCNHGILMVAMKLYERGASLGQVMAFLIASPWNSFTLTFILVGLIGLPWTLAFIGFSMLIAWSSGLLFDRLEHNGTLPSNPNRHTLPQDFQIKATLLHLIKTADYSPQATATMLWDGIKGVRMVVRWLLFGIVLVAIIRAFVPQDVFNQWFGASIAGILLTLLAATLIEVCSEGSTPIAADLVNRAAAPGNGFTFLMAGAATDYTELMVVKDTTQSWKIALFLPLITVPQVLLIGWLMNLWS